MQVSFAFQKFMEFYTPSLTQTLKHTQEKVTLPQYGAPKIVTCLHFAVHGGHVVKAIGGRCHSWPWLKSYSIGSQSGKNL